MDDSFLDSSQDLDSGASASEQQDADFSQPLDSKGGSSTSSISSSAHPTISSARKSPRPPFVFEKAEQELKELAAACQKSGEEHAAHVFITRFRFHIKCTCFARALSVYLHAIDKIDNVLYYINFFK